MKLIYILTLTMVAPFVEADGSFENKVFVGKIKTELTKMEFSIGRMESRANFIINELKKQEAQAKEIRELLQDIE